MKPACGRLLAIPGLAVLLWTVSVAQGADASLPPRAREFPQVAMLWASIRNDPSIEAIARHDLVLLGPEALGLKYDRQPPGLAGGFTPESNQVARQRIARVRELNPNVIILAEVLFYEWPERWLPEDHSWWLRKNGKRQQFWPGTYRMNWFDPEYRRHMVARTAWFREAGVDGVFYDNLREEPAPWVAFLKEVRQQIGDDFLLLANCGYAVAKHDFAAPFLNGFMYESGWSHDRTEWTDVIRKMQHSESLLRSPRISVIERFEEIRDGAGWPGDARRGQKPLPDPAARRWSLAYSLIVGDYFYLFSDNTSHRHDWYPEYGFKIGRALGPGSPRTAHAWTRSYEKALVAVNLPGAQSHFTVSPGFSAKDTLTGEVGTSFQIPPGDGRILLKQPDLPSIGRIDLYGLRSLAAMEIRTRLGLKEGDPAPTESTQLEHRLEQIPGVLKAKLTIVCCEEGTSTLFVGIQERIGTGFAYNQFPDGSESLPDDIIRTYDRFQEALAQSIQHGDTHEDDSQGHALYSAPALQPFQEAFGTFARSQSDLLKAALHTSADAKTRAIAAWVLGYSPDKRRVLGELMRAVRDPDEGVRNNATRAIGAIAALANSKPELGLQIDSGVFIQMLNSLSWTDRNKAMMVLLNLTDRAAPDMPSKMRKEALPSLIEMARWKDGHSLQALQLLGRIAGISEQDVGSAWRQDHREPIIRKALEQP